MQSLPYHRRNYKLLENQCLNLFSIVAIDDNNFDQPNSTYAALIHDIVPLIESLAKDLHQELGPQFPDLPQFKPKERFDFESLAFLDQALYLSSKQVKLTSELVALSEESGHRILIPLQDAHDKDKTKHPLWSRAYQSYKHNQANTQQDSVDCPTAQALLEAIGAAFLLLAVARSLPIDAENKFTKFDFTFGSDLFTTTYTRAIFTGLIGPLHPKCIEFFEADKDHALFVVKDPEGYIKDLHAEIHKNGTRLAPVMHANPEFRAFYDALNKPHKDQEESAVLLNWYYEATEDPTKRAWIHNLLVEIVLPQLLYIKLWNDEEHYQLRPLGFDPVVALNYKDASELYDYKKLNQDSPEVQQQ